MLCKNSDVTVQLLWTRSSFFLCFYEVCRGVCMCMVCACVWLCGVYVLTVECVCVCGRYAGGACGRCEYGVCVVCACVVSVVSVCICVWCVYREGSTGPAYHPPLPPPLQRSLVPPSISWSHGILGLSCGQGVPGLPTPFCQGCHTISVTYRSSWLQHVDI